MTKLFNAYAPPNFWGKWVNIQAHGGKVSFTVSYKAIGNTMVMGKVRYFKRNNPKKAVEEQFKDEVTIKTANVWANISVCFKGIPLGSAVRGSIK